MLLLGCLFDLLVVRDLVCCLLNSVAFDGCRVGLIVFVVILLIVVFECCVCLRLG